MIHFSVKIICADRVAIIFFIEDCIMLTMRPVNELYKKLFPYEHVLEQLCQNSLTKPSAPDINIDFPNQRTFWYKVVQLANENNLVGVFAPTFRTLRNQGILPWDVYNRTERDYVVVRLRALKQQAVFLDILSALKKRGLPCIVMKTFPLSHLLYPGGPIKVSRDLDVLVPVAGYHDTTSFLARRGFLFVPNPKNPTMTNTMPSNKYATPKSQQQFQKGECRIEIHTAIVDSYDFFSNVLTDEDVRKMTLELSSQTQMITAGNTRIAVFAPTTLFLSLFLHIFFQHNFRHAISYYEVARVLGVFEHKIQWNFVMAFIKKYGLVSYFYWFMSLFVVLFPRVIPIKLEQQIRSYRSSLSVLQRIAWYCARYNMFHSTPYPLNKLEHLEKKLTWATVDKKLVKLSVREFKRRLYGRYVNS